MFNTNINVQIFQNPLVKTSRIVFRSASGRKLLPLQPSQMAFFELQEAKSIIYFLLDMHIP